MKDDVKFCSSPCPQVPGNAIRSLQLAPFGVIRMIWPLAGNQAAFGLDLFACGFT